MMRDFLPDFAAEAGGEVLDVIDGVDHDGVAHAVRDRAPPACRSAPASRRNSRDTGSVRTALIVRSGEARVLCGSRTTVGSLVSWCMSMTCASERRRCSASSARRRLTRSSSVSRNQIAPPNRMSRFTAASRPCTSSGAVSVRRLRRAGSGTRRSGRRRRGRSSNSDADAPKQMCCAQAAAHRAR